MGLVAILAAAAIWLLYRHIPTNKPIRQLVSLAGGGDVTSVILRNDYSRSDIPSIGPRSLAEGKNHLSRAHLTIENHNPHDRSAVLVSIEGYTVGYLPRAAAQKFRRTVASAGHRKTLSFDCPAAVKGRSENERNGGPLSVWIDLP